ncbi:monocarboxylate transporter 12-like [Patiria miniata]|uniref:Major facilitator superfamily (MFS) profile domain-containing protein n=1 Tax=Patiria miniata TaxID=46514 RepID=A0A913YWR0_PATMI|nr:monocarboxylate transporter 12-like [Patiria miniata]
MTSNMRDTNVSQIQDEASSMGWVAVLTMWTRGVIRVAMLKGLGMMLPTLQDQFGTTTWAIGWMTSLIVAVGGLVAPMAGLLGRRFGAGNVIMICGAMIGIAFIASSFAKTSIQLTMILTLLAGSPLIVPLVLTKEAIGRCYNKNLAKASGIARTGSSIGLVVAAPLIQISLDTFGWRGTMLLIGGGIMHLVPCGVLMRKNGTTPNNSYQEVPKDEPETAPPSACAACLESVFKNFDLSLLRNFQYWSVAAIYVCFNFAYDMWVIYFVSQALSKGFSLEDAAVFVTVAGVGNLLAKVSQGFIIDAGLISCWGLMVICIIVSSLAFFVTPWLAWYWTMMLTALLVVICDGVLACLHDVLAKQVLGVELLAGAYGWMDVKATMARLFFGFIPGWIYDTTGSYNAAFIFLGCLQLVCMIPLVVLKYVHSVK